MQNRFVLSGVPMEVRSRPDAEQELREFVEDRTCWIDRFAWINGVNDDDGQFLTAAMELNLENVRNRAVKELDGLAISLLDGSLCFTTRAAPATRTQSAQLLRRCPDNGKKKGIDDYTGTISCTKALLQVLRLDVGKQDERKILELRVHRTTEGGTGSEAWRGGVLLAQQICRWYNNHNDPGQEADDLLERLFGGRHVLELGAGSAALPSMTLAALSLLPNDKNNKSSSWRPRSIVASDAIDEVLETLRKNLEENNLLQHVNVQTIDWNQYLPSTTTSTPCFSVDCIMFTDCIYTNEGGEALCRAINALLVPGGHVVGVLPDFRVGLDTFEVGMIQSGFHPTQIPQQEQRSMDIDQRTATSDGDRLRFQGAGGSSNNYRIVWWSDFRGLIE